MVINNDISVLRVTPTPTTKVVAGDAALVSRATAGTGAAGSRHSI